MKCLQRKKDLEYLLKSLDICYLMMNANDFEGRVSLLSSPHDPIWSRNRRNHLPASRYDEHVLHASVTMLFRSNGHAKMILIFVSGIRGSTTTTHEPRNWPAILTRIRNQLSLDLSILICRRLPVVQARSIFLGFREIMRNPTRIVPLYSLMQPQHSARYWKAHSVLTLDPCTIIHAACMPQSFEKVSKWLQPVYLPTSFRAR